MRYSDSLFGTGSLALRHVRRVLAGAERVEELPRGQALLPRRRELHLPHRSQPPDEILTKRLIKLRSPKSKKIDNNVCNIFQILEGSFSAVSKPIEIQIEEEC